MRRNKMQKCRYKIYILKSNRIETTASGNSKADLIAWADSVCCEDSNCSYILECCF